MALGLAAAMFRAEHVLSLQTRPGHLTWPIGLSSTRKHSSTCRVLERLGKQAPGAMDAYEKLLPHQPAIYRTHLGWLENHSPEEVRDAMLTIRCRGAGSVAEFEYLLSEARSRRRNR